MIDKKPGDWSDELMDGIDERAKVHVTLYDREPSRKSAVLGPDGKPVTVDLPRRRIGFDLRSNA